MGKIRRISNIIQRKKVISLWLLLSFVWTFSLLGIPTYAESNGGYVAKYVGASVGGQYVNISSVGNVFMEVVPTTDGSMSVTSDSISVETNADTGYRLYISGYNTESNGYTALYKDGNTTSSSKIASIPASTPTVFSSSYLNTWGWAVGYNASNGASTGFSEDSAYSSLANTGTVTDPSTIASLKWKGISGDYQAISSGSSANEGSPDNVTLYYSTYVNKDMPTGNYRNIVVYTAFVEGSNNITVSPSEVEDGDTITVETEHQRSPAPITADQIRVQLYDHTDPSKDLGTCTDITVDSTYDGTTNRPLKFTCVYHKGADVEGDADYDITVEVDTMNNGIYISYSKENVWQLFLPKLRDGMEMQDVNAEICANTPLYSVSSKTYSLTDKRDNKKYLVRKLADNKCWMVQNLALAGNRTIYGPGVSGHEEDSNLPSGVSYNIPDGAAYTSKFSSNTAEDMYNGTHKDGQNDNTSDNTGAYYNWPAATAGTGTYSVKSGNANGSICPKGWKLPLAGDTEANNGIAGAFGYLLRQEGLISDVTTYTSMSNDMMSKLTSASNTSEGHQLTFLRSGRYNYSSGAASNRGSDGYYWSHTAFSDNLGFILFFGANFVGPGTGNYAKGNGFAVRCVSE